MMEYAYGQRFRYDGVSETWCEHGRFGRWCGLELAPDEVEPPYCQGRNPHPVIDKPVSDVLSHADDSTVLGEPDDPCLAEDRTGAPHICDLCADEMESRTEYERTVREN